MKIKLRPLHRTAVIPEEALKPQHREMLMYLLQRYGVNRVRDLLPIQCDEFSAELTAILAGKAPHPADPCLKQS